MKRLYFLFILISSTLYSQSDSVNVKSDSLIFEYRFKIVSITNDFESLQLQDKLTDLFKIKPVFYDEFSQYVFNSKVDLEKTALEKLLISQNLVLEYYRKAVLLIKKPD